MARRDSEAATRLSTLFGELRPEDQRTLLDFAEFLAARSETPGPARVFTLRPEQETVVQAVKRLNASYPMLERTKLLAPVGELLSRHMLEGGEAAAVIDELETLYARAFAAYVQGT